MARIMLNGVDYSTPTASGVAGVKGNAETSYRSGNVNLTPENIGAARIINTVLPHVEQHPIVGTPLVIDEHSQTIRSVYITNSGKQKHIFSGRNYISNTASFDMDLGNVDSYLDYSTITVCYEIGGSSPVIWKKGHFICYGEAIYHDYGEAWHLDIYKTNIFAIRSYLEHSTNDNSYEHAILSLDAVGIATLASSYSTSVSLPQICITDVYATIS